MSQPAVEETTLKGIGASPGICIGKAYLVDKEGVDVVKKYYLKGEKIKSEINRFKAAVKKLRMKFTPSSKTVRKNCSRPIFLKPTWHC